MPWKCAETALAWYWETEGHIRCSSAESRGVPVSDRPGAEVWFPPYVQGTGNPVEDRAVKRSFIGLCLGKLTQEQRDVLELRISHQLGFAEAAKALHIAQERIIGVYATAMGTVRADLTRRQIIEGSEQMDKHPVADDWIHGWYDLARYTGLSRDELKRYCRGGAFSAIHLGGVGRGKSVKFLRPDIDSWLNRLTGGLTR